MLQFPSPCRSATVCVPRAVRATVSLIAVLCYLRRCRASPRSGPCYVVLRRYADALCSLASVVCVFMCVCCVCVLCVVATGSECLPPTYLMAAFTGLSAGSSGEPEGSVR